jgi:hypothetical protein
VPKHKLEAILKKYSNVFKELPGGYVQRPGIDDMSIDIEPGKSPPVGVTYRLSHAQYVQCEQMIKDGLQKGLLEVSSSPYGAPVLFVKKKGTSALRMCCDYRALNKITVKNKYPLPLISDLLDRLRDAKVFSGLDLQSGYNQLFIKKEDQHKTTFRTPFGSYQWKVIPFGLTNAPSHFMACMNKIFHDLIGKCVYVYIDDILVFSSSPEQHEKDLEAVLARLQEYNLYARLPKCHFNLPEVEFLGHRVGRDGIKVDERKVQIVRDWPTPKSQTDLRSFLGLANYFRRFIHAYSAIARPLHALTGNVKWRPSLWTGDCQKSFDMLKHKLCTAPTLAMPDFSDTAGPFQIIADASQTSLGAILLQYDKPIAFESRLHPCRVQL